MAEFGETQGEDVSSQGRSTIPRSMLQGIAQALVAFSASSYTHRILLGDFEREALGAIAEHVPQFGSAPMPVEAFEAELVQLANSRLEVSRREVKGLVTDLVNAVVSRKLPPPVNAGKFSSEHLGLSGVIDFGEGRYRFSIPWEVDEASGKIEARAVVTTGFENETFEGVDLPDVVARATFAQKRFVIGKAPWELVRSESGYVAAVRLSATRHANGVMSISGRYRILISKAVQVPNPQRADGADPIDTRGEVFELYSGIQFQLLELEQSIGPLFQMESDDPDTFTGSNHAPEDVPIEREELSDAIVSARDELLKGAPDPVKLQKTAKLFNKWAREIGLWVMRKADKALDSTAEEAGKSLASWKSWVALWFIFSGSLQDVATNIGHLLVALPHFP